LDVSPPCIATTGDGEQPGHLFPYDEQATILFQCVATLCRRNRLRQKISAASEFFDPRSVYEWMFEVTLEMRGRSRWWWQVQDLSGKAIMAGWENSRSEAKYQGERALFQLLMTTARINL
jgi:hypothetical protein